MRRSGCNLIYLFMHVCMFDYVRLYICIPRILQTLSLPPPLTLYRSPSIFHPNFTSRFFVMLLLFFASAFSVICIPNTLPPTNR